MPNKTAITQRLIEQLDAQDCPDLESAMTIWWQDWRPEKGLRLTAEGRDLFDQLKYTSHRFEIPTVIAVVPRNLLILERKLTCPYHIQLGKKPVLTLYGDKEATLFALFNNPDKFMALLAQT
jgi:hypothetical protein